MSTVSRQKHLSVLSPVARWMAQQGLSCRGLAAEMGQSKSSVAGKVNGSLHWQQADLVWLYRMKGLPSDFVLGNDAALVNRLLSSPAKEGSAR